MTRNPDLLIVPRGTEQRCSRAPRKLMLVAAMVGLVLVVASCWPPAAYTGVG